MISGFQEADVLSMTKALAFTAINTRLWRANGVVYTLRVIHGYHGSFIRKILSGFIPHSPTDMLSYRRMSCYKNRGGSRVTCKCGKHRYIYLFQRDRIGDPFSASQAEILKRVLIVFALISQGVLRVVLFI